ncbi:NTP pyrophosphohydrolase [Streptomyces sp. HB2AG]|uniref:NTP pyrophosphohydrolase n=1 Tax=Streptomyces sp. HB2AG TaxID=2983400 RepID=UPI0022AAE9AA|nr:NTP pyrophosphohydrolase [Streptomyces sp. HB2AG]MCZ2525552.1 NTP pyrophosphohydrolase [Streptomyces sp. HB2AG]
MENAAAQPACPPPLVVVDGANVVGSVPDGWWRDRAAANARLRDELAGLPARGLPDRGDVPGWAVGTPVEVVLVVEGAARGVAGVPGVRVSAAPGEGDDHIVEVVAGRAPGRRCLVVTADRLLRTRVRALGAETCGPRAVRGVG